MTLGLLVTMLSNPYGYFWSKISIIPKRSLKEGDFSQNPKVNFWHKLSILVYRVFGFEIREAKNLTNAGEDTHFSRKCI